MSIAWDGENDGGKPDTPWSRIDSVAISALVLAGAAVRTIGLTYPGQKVFDEAYYTVDACILALGPGPPCHAAGTDIVPPVHPPLGMALIGVGIRMFGFRPGAWRLAPLAAGVATIALVYVLGRLVLRSTTGAVIAAGALALDFLHIVHSRLAMLEVFVTLFGVATFLCLFLDARPHRSVGRVRVRDRPWRLAAGLMAGAAAATKWTGLVFVVAALWLTIVSEADRQADRPRLRRVLREEGASLLASFVAVPAAVYMLSFVGTTHGSLLVWPWSEGSWIRTFLADQWRMLRFHLNLDSPHVYGSPAWSWPLLKRPVVYFYEPVGSGYREILAFGSPLAWWGSIGAMGWLAARWRLGRERHGGEGLILAGFAISWVPWLVLSPIRSGGFLFYLLPSVPFMCLALGWAATRLAARRVGVPVVAVVVAAALGLFIIYRPLLYASPIDLHDWERRVLFRDCDLDGLRLDDISLPPQVEPPVDAPGPYPEALLRHGSPPTGWCWI